MNILQIQGLYKKFGQNNIINGLDLEVKENTIFGFIGENGAGKTTTMKMILGFLKQDSGVIKVCGEEVKFGETKTNKFIGYLPDVPEYYGYMTPLEYLKLCGEITNMKKAAEGRKTLVTCINILLIFIPAVLLLVLPMMRIGELA